MLPIKIPKESYRNITSHLYMHTIWLQPIVESGNTQINMFVFSFLEHS